LRQIVTMQNIVLPCDNFLPYHRKPRASFRSIS
jgi:hypothetical protein